MKWLHRGTCPFQTLTFHSQADRFPRVHHAAQVRREYIKPAQIDQGKIRDVLAGDWDCGPSLNAEPSAKWGGVLNLNTYALNTYSLSWHIVAGTSS